MLLRDPFLPGHFQIVYKIEFTRVFFHCTGKRPRNVDGSYMLSSKCKILIPYDAIYSNICSVLRFSNTDNTNPITFNMYML